MIFFAAKFYEFSRGEWAVLLLTCGAVLSLEVVNTAVERLCDKVSPEKDPKIGAAKDCAAGAVLISAIIAAAVGGCLFWDRDALARIFEFFSQPLPLAALIGAVAAAWGIVFLPEMIKQK